MTKLINKSTSSKVSSLAATVLNGSHKPTKAEIMTLAATALSQDPKKGK